MLIIRNSSGISLAFNSGHIWLVGVVYLAEIFRKTEICTAIITIVHL